MAFDYKKEYKEFYAPSTTPEIAIIPSMNFIAVRGSGNPNDENGDYKDNLGLLYGIAFTLKMSPKMNHEIKGYFSYVVPPLEGFWWQRNRDGMDYGKKEEFEYISLIRIPDFITKEDFDWAKEVATKKKKKDFSKVEFFTYDEGCVVQCMHLGSFDDEPATIEKMDELMEKMGYENDITTSRYHHEIYLSDPRRVEVSHLRTILRHPIKRKEL
jgi:hypothetical protein